MNIFEKLLAVRKSVDYLQKVSQGHGFKYTSSSQVLGAVRQAMNEQGLILVPHVVNAEVTDHQTSGGKTWKFTQLHVNYEWVDSADPSQRLMVPFYAQGMDDMEKGVGKALTYGEKYFMLKFFNIPTDLDDPDAFIPKDEKPKYVAPQPEPAKAPAEAPAPRKMDDPATAGQVRFVKSLAAKHGFTIPDGMTKSQAAALIKKHGG